MGRRLTSVARQLGLVLMLAIPGAAHAACTVPPALQKQVLAHSSEEGAVEVGNWFAGHKQFDCALEVFRTALRTNPRSAQLHYLEGLALSTLNRSSEAIASLQESIRLEPQVLKSHLLLATLLDHAGRTDEAEEQWQLALGIDPHSELAMESLSDDLFAQNNFIAVVELLRNAPRTEKLTVTLANALGKLNYLDTAKKVLTEAMAITPKSLPLANTMAVVLVKQRRYQEAIDMAQVAVKDHPGDQDAEVLLFRLLVLNQQNDRARQLGPKLLALRPHDAEILYLNGLVERSFGEDAQAKAHLEEAVALDPNFFSYRYNLGAVLDVLHEWKEAAEQLEKAIALGDQEPEVHFQLALALRGLGDTDRARQEIQKYQDIKKEEEIGVEAASAAAQGDADMADGKPQDAVAHYREAIDRLPDNAAYKYELSVALHKIGDLEGERAQLEQAVKLDPKLAAAQKQLGYLLSRSGDAAGAVEHFKMAVRVSPQWTEAWINLAAELAVESRFDEARQAIAIALRLEPDNAQARTLSDRLEQDAASRSAQP